jgi:5,10-methenyltetrahydrofolate synthetase
MLHELGPDGVLQIDMQQSVDVAHWRKAERERQLSARMAMPADVREVQTLAIAKSLERLVRATPDTIISVYWPIKAEPDLRPWMHSSWEGGARMALPVATALGQALTFREWRPGTEMSRGLWKIPFPADGAEVVPTVVLAPLVGFDADCFRLGYGGGFFDRTLAGLAPRPLAIGVGYSAGCMRTIYPQPHDIPMDWIVTGTAPPVERRRQGRRSGL